MYLYRNIQQYEILQTLIFFIYMWNFMVNDGEIMQNFLYYLSIIWGQFLYWYSCLYILMLYKCLCCDYSQTQIWWHLHLAPLSICEQKFHFCRILVYCHPQYTTTNFSEKKKALDWGLTVFVVPYSLCCRITDLLSIGSNLYSTHQNQGAQIPGNQVFYVVCNISSIIIVVLFLTYENVYQFTHSR